ncbi:MAG: YscK family type III secretion system sorting platform protein [Sulfitobacter sp.]|nr:YscK family type III secretion system sorting platform protein [Sulfitobacter sp.]
MADGLMGLPGTRWVPAALTFNFDPCSFVHDSWIASVPHGVLAQRLRDEPGAVAQASRYLRQAFELEGDPCDDFSAPRSRLALLDGDSLSLLSLYLGLALRSHELRSEVRGERLRSVKLSVGDDAYAFAVKRAPFLGSMPVFPYEPGSDEPKLRFTLIGLRFCVAQLADLNSGLRRRMMLKMPRDWMPAFETAEDRTGRPDADNGLASIVLKLIKDILPRWHPLFA